MLLSDSPHFSNRSRVNQIESYDSNCESQDSNNTAYAMVYTMGSEVIFSFFPSNNCVCNYDIFGSKSSDI